MLNAQGQLQQADARNDPLARNAGGFRTERLLHNRRSPERRLVKGGAYAMMGTMGRLAYVGLWIHHHSRWLRSPRPWSKASVIGA